MQPALAIDFITLFPGLLDGFVSESMIGRACEAGIVAMRVHNLRDWATDRWHVTDDRPFGGGAGMVLKPEPLCAALDSVHRPGAVRIFLTPDGEPLTSAIARDLATHRHLILVSGHYEGIDQRVRDTRIDRELSIGDYILTNGTIASAVLADAVCRYVPGVLGEEKSLTQDSFNHSLLGFPQYTRPVEFEGRRVPDVLLSGNHGEIDRWRTARRIEKTQARRPDLLLNHSPIS
jgi:tRNA (guanine37-N1)-methyltransferase